jgi:hypothetical protein
MSVAHDRYLTALNLACDAHLTRVKAAALSRAAAVRVAGKLHIDFHPDTRPAYTAAVLASSQAYAKKVRTSEGRRTQEEDAALAVYRSTGETL